MMTKNAVPQSIFRAYDIRGIVGELLNEDVIYNIARAVGTMMRRAGHNELVVARDARISSDDLSAALQRGLLDSGCHLVDIGVVPTPLMYFATYTLPQITSGIMLTASHNPSNYNGLKIVKGRCSFTEAEIQALYHCAKEKDFISGKGTYCVQDISEAYIQYISAQIKLNRPLKIVIDGGNAVPGKVAPSLFRKLGCEVIELYCQLDGNFPHHQPDPSQPDNLIDLQHAVYRHQADIGLAFDGDGDRLGVVTDQGTSIMPDRQLMLYAITILKSDPGAEIIFDVKCTNHLKKIIEQKGGKATMWRTGHSLIKAKLQETKAALAGEMSGHVFFNDKWFGFDDGIYTAARLLEIIASQDETVENIFKNLPDSVNTPELKIQVDDEKKFALMDKLVKHATFPEADIITVDGLRVEYTRGWGLIRPSNTSPCLVLRFEADDKEALSAIQQQFRKEILSVDPLLVLPF